MWSLLSRLKSFKVPDKEWFSQGVPSFTPDVALLETRPFWLLMVVDEMMAPHFKNIQLGDTSLKRADAYTMDKFSLWKKDSGNESEVVPLETKFFSAPYTHIRGQLWKVPTERIFVLDSMKKNGVEFLRKRVQIALPFHYVEWDKDGQPRTRRFMDTSFKAWMYVGNDNLWKDRLLKGGKIVLKNGWHETVGRVVEGETYYPVKTYVPKNPLLTEEYYYYARGEYFNSE